MRWRPAKNARVSSSRRYSKAGAAGLGQLMLGTAPAVGVSNRFDPMANTFGAARYLRQMLDKVGVMHLALAAYNAGPAPSSELAASRAMVKHRPMCAMSCAIGTFKPGEVVSSGRVRVSGLLSRGRRGMLLTTKDCEVWVIESDDPSDEFVGATVVVEGTVVGIDRLRRERPPDHAEIREEMRDIASRRRRFGYRRVGIMLERKGHIMNHKKLSLADARRKPAMWRYDYNNVRPHSSLANRTPAQARRACLQDGSVPPGALVPVAQHEYQTGGLSL